MRKLSAAFAALSLSMLPAVAQAATTSISSFDNGWYDATGAHSPTNTNIINRAAGRPQINNFFLFDLGGVGLSTITSATLTITGGNGQYLSSSSASETYNIFDIVTNIESLLGGTGGTAAFNDLQSGAQYGSATVLTPGDHGSMPTVTIALDSAAIANLNTALNASDTRFGLGGTTPTLSGGEELWGNSNGSGAASLSLTGSAIAAVPVPASLPLAASGMLLLGSLAQRRRRKQGQARTS